MGRTSPAYLAIAIIFSPVSHGTSAPIALVQGTVWADCLGGYAAAGLAEGDVTWMLRVAWVGRSGARGSEELTAFASAFTDHGTAWMDDVGPPARISVALYAEGVVIAHAACPPLGSKG